METIAGKLEKKGKKTLSRQTHCLYDVTDVFVFITSVTVLSSPVFRVTTKNAAVRSERRRAVGGRQIEHSYFKVGQSVGSMKPGCLCINV